MMGIGGAGCTALHSAIGLRYVNWIVPAPLYSPLTLKPWASFSLYNRLSTHATKSVYDHLPIGTSTMQPMNPLLFTP